MSAVEAMTLFIAFYFFLMRYHYEESKDLSKRYGQVYCCTIRFIPGAHYL